MRGAPDDMTSIDAGEAPVFQVRIASTGDAFDVPGHKSILHVLVENGYRVLRFWNNDVLRNTDAVLEEILSAIHGDAE